MITQLNIHNIRNLHAVSISVGWCNVFIGINGSGKTSLLESLFLLSRGKSFRHHQPKRYISHHKPNAVVYAKLSNDNSMAIQKSQDASTVMRLGQQPIYGQSMLTRQLPTLLIDPSSMDILEMGSSKRRQLLDWIVFHVEHGFHSQWMSYQRLLKQRNALLKKTNNLNALQRQELSSWDKGLAIHADLITHYRKQVFNAWKPLFDELLEQLLPEHAPFIQLRFVPGYNTEYPLDILLQDRLQQDCHMGYTRIGCHRSEVQVLWVDDAKARHEVYEQEKSEQDSQQVNYLNVPNNNKVNSKSDKKHQTIADNILNNKRNSTDSSNDNISLDAVFEDSVNATFREQAANVLSRGEKKLLITALRLSQLPLLAKQEHLGFKEQSEYHNNTDKEKIEKKCTEKNAGDHSDLNDEELVVSDLITDKSYDCNIELQHSESASPLVLLDDITAELDQQALDILLKTLSELSCQVFITSLEESVITKVKHYWSEVNLFHVKQGEINPY